MNPERIGRTLLPAAVAAVLAAAAPALADDRGAGRRYSREGYPYGELVNQPLTLPATLFRIDLPLHVNLTKDHVGEPWFVPFSLDLGVTDDIQIGVIHERGLCLSGTSNGCPETYDDIGGRLLVSLSRTPEAQLALEVNALAFEFDDTQLRGGLALAYKRSIGNIGVEVRGGIDVFLTDRDARPFKEVAFAEGLGALQLGDALAAFARIRLQKALQEAAGVSVPFEIPVAFGAEFEPIRKLTVGAELEFGNLLGEDATADERELIVFLRVYI